MEEWKMAQQMAMTALIFTLLFFGIIKFHGEDNPSYLLMAIEGLGLSVSFLTFIVSSLCAIWIN
jgi:hypothetical protein